MIAPIFMPPAIVARAFDAVAPRCDKQASAPDAVDTAEVSAQARVPEAATVAQAPGWTLAWSDEFDGRDGASPDARKWALESGGHGWGNHELQYYTARPENVCLQGGNLVITARRENFSGPDGRKQYTSARLKTAKLFEQQYGRFEARIKIPRGQGMWPAFWMLGSDIDTAGWPDCGEIDIMENIGKEPSTVHGSLHGPGYSGGHPLTGTFKLPDGAKFADDFHRFAVEWEPGTVRFYVDDKLYNTIKRESAPSGAKWVFDHPFFLLLNVAVGGDWPGPPDGKTAFPQTMQVDYVRAYRRSVDGPAK